MPSKMKEPIVVDFHDLESCRKLREKYGDSKLPFLGENENGEMVIISISKDNISTQTFQDNGWVRINTLWEDSMYEELYDR